MFTRYMQKRSARHGSVDPTRSTDRRRFVFLPRIGHPLSRDTSGSANLRTVRTSIGRTVSASVCYGESFGQRGSPLFANPSRDQRFCATNRCPPRSTKIIGVTNGIPIAVVTKSNHAVIFTPKFAILRAEIFQYLPTRIELEAKVFSAVNRGHSAGASPS